MLEDDLLKILNHFSWSQFILLTISILIGFFIIYCFSKRNFNTGDYSLQNESFSGKKIFLQPMLPAFMINKRKYNFWFKVFLLINTFIWAAIALYLMESNTKISKSEWMNPFPALAAAVIISGLLPEIPFVKNIVEFIRKETHNCAMIPEKATTIVDNLKSKRLLISQKERERTIDYVGGDHLNDQDFKEGINSAEYKWAISCFLKMKIDEFSGSFDPYLKNTHKPEIDENFNKILHARKIMNGLTTYSSKENSPIDEEYIKDNIQHLFCQVCQLMVCLILSSVQSEVDVYKKLNEIGVRSSSPLKYTINLETLAVLSFISLAFFILVFVVSILLLRDDSNEKSRNIAIAASLIFFIPTFAVFLSKMCARDRWPLRLPFDKKFFNIYFFHFIFGIFLGFVSFYIIKYFELFEFSLGWKGKCLPFTLVAGLVSFLVAYHIDIHPQEKIFKNIFIDSFLKGIIAFVIFYILTLFIFGLTSEKDIFPEDFNLISLFQPKHYKYSFISGAAGFFLLFLTNIVSYVSYKSLENVQIDKHVFCDLFLDIIAKNNSHSVTDPTADKKLKHINEFIQNNKKLFGKKMLKYLQKRKYLDKNFEIIAEHAETVTSCISISD